MTATFTLGPNALLLFQTEDLGSGSRRLNLIRSDGAIDEFLATIGTYASNVALPDIRDFVTRPGFAGARTLFTVQQPGLDQRGLPITHLWETDGTPSGTRLLNIPGIDQATASIDEVTVFGGRLAFVATQADGGRELHIWDGFGTPRAFNISPTPGFGSNPSDLTVFNGNLFFAATGEFPVGREIYRFDGQNVALLKDVWNWSYEPETKEWWEEVLQYVGIALALIGLRSVVTAAIATLVETLAKTILVAAGLPQNPIQYGLGYVFEQFLDDRTASLLSNVLATGINMGLGIGNDAPLSLGVSVTNLLSPVAEDGERQSGSGLAGTPSLFVLGNKLLFAGTYLANPADNRLETLLWVSDGTTAGTQPLTFTDWNGRVQDIGSPGNFMLLPDGRALFGAGDGTGASSARYLYVTDGTLQGTREVTRSDRVDPGPALIGSDYAQINDGVVFGATSQYSNRPGWMQRQFGEGHYAGTELWFSNGGHFGTYLLADLLPGNASSNPAQFRAFGNGVLFIAGAPGDRKLYFTDGTPGGTRLVRDDPGLLQALGSMNFVFDTTSPNASFGSSPALTNASRIALRGTTDGLDATSVTLRLSKDGEPATEIVLPVVNARWNYWLENPADGRWSVTASATDRNFNQDRTPATTAFTVDRTPPETQISGPTTIRTKNEFTVGGTTDPDGAEVLLRLTSVTDRGVSSYEQRVAVSDGTWQATISDLPYRNIWIGGAYEYQLTATAIDAAGNNDPTPASLSVVLDQVGPRTQIVAQQPNKADGFDLIVPLFFTSGDAPVRVSLTLDGERFWVVEGSELSSYFGSPFTQIRIPGADYEDGTVTLTATAWDAVGNTSVTTETLEIDRPEFWFDFEPATVTPDAMPRAVNGTTTTITGRAGPDATFVRIRDAQTVTTLTEAPVTDGMWSATLDTSGADRFISLMLQAQDRGDNLDWAGGAPRASVNFRIDRTAPDSFIDTRVTGTGRIEGPTREALQGFRDWADIRLTITAPDGTVTEAVVTDGTGRFPDWWGYTIPNAQEGIHTIVAAARDEVGNEDATPATASVLVDFTPPETTIDAPAPGFVGFTGTTSGDEVTGGASAVRWRYSSTGFDSLGNAVFTSPVAPDGRWATGFDFGAPTRLFIEAWAVDAAGNEDPTRARAELWRPGETFISQTRGDGLITGSAAFSKEVLLTLTGPGGVVLNEVVQTTDEISGAWSYVLQRDLPGAWQVSAAGRSRSGFEDATPATASFTLLDVPETTLNAPTVERFADGGGRVWLSGTAEDATNIAITFVRPDGTTGTTGASVGAGGNWTTSVLVTDGAWNFSAAAVNSSLGVGNAITDPTPATGSVLVDLTPPETALAAIPSVINSVQTAISGTATAGDATLVRLSNNFNGGAGDDVILVGNVMLADIYALFAA